MESVSDDLSWEQKWSPTLLSYLLDIIYRVKREWDTVDTEEANSKFLFG